MAKAQALRWYSHRGADSIALKEPDMFIAVPIQLKKTRQPDVIPVVNGLIIAVNVLVFWLGWSANWYVGAGTGLFSIVTYAFAHAGPWHLIGNMWVLLVFGNRLNSRIGNGYYLLSYLGAVVTLGILARVFVGGGLVGASGAVFAVIAMSLLLMPAALIEIFYVALFPITVLIGLLRRPPHWVFWLIRWDRFDLRALWGLAIVPLLEIWDLTWTGWNWTNLAHLLGFFCGIGITLLLPGAVTMRRRSR
jgi:membrane associated rhomboid family serine protease